ncbi:non-specific lipid transfer protein GPI-anchored 14-like [Nicotiana sylvestris]|uniref:Protein YLS3-like n=1 Tax=Nicotiana sylvestris TaxID=4096 RepID=A0A1U7WHG2_NICSY|nr:PREDICTED: protein YLS3-like [Nicotiana sylvestris]
MAFPSVTISNFILMLLMIGFASSDFAEDRKECQNQLLHLSSCLSYVGGDAQLPTPACCAQLRKDLHKTKYCLCLIVKDRNEPNIGYKINATLALGLPYVCGAPTNVSECPAILKLAPNSPDAQVFIDFVSHSKTGNNASIGDVQSSSSIKFSNKRWFAAGRDVGVAFCVLIFVMITMI